MLKGKEVTDVLIEGIEFTPDCQNKWDFDGSILTVSSRGYDWEGNRSFYVGFNLTLRQFKNHDFPETVEILADEIIEEDFYKLKMKVKQWYKDHLIEALEKALKILKGELLLVKNKYGLYEVEE